MDNLFSNDYSIKKVCRGRSLWRLEVTLKNIKTMLPIFHAGGRNLYAKCCYVYVQDMENLKENEHPELITKGFFTVRRTDKFWCGIPPDQTIECGLMKLFKDPSKGLTHGRGTGDVEVAKWILSLPMFIDILEGFEDYCSFSFEINEQHKAPIHQDGTTTRIKQDYEDFMKIIQWFEQYPPFADTNKIMSISTGVIGDQRVNCYQAFNKGLQGIKSITNVELGKVKISRKTTVVPLSIMTSKVNITRKDIPVDPTLLFQRISLTDKSEHSLQHILGFELAPYPMSLFDENGMRKNKKSVLYDFFQPVTDNPVFVNPTYIIDGGYLLHKFRW